MLGCFAGKLATTFQEASSLPVASSPQVSAVWQAPSEEAPAWLRPEVCVAVDAHSPEDSAAGIQDDYYCSALPPEHGWVDCSAAPPADVPAPRLGDSSLDGYSAALWADDSPPDDYSVAPQADGLADCSVAPPADVPVLRSDDSFPDDCSLGDCSADSLAADSLAADSPELVPDDC